MRTVSLGLLAAVVGLALGALPAAAENIQSQQLINRIQLVIERARAEQQRMEGEMILREAALRREYDSQTATLREELAALRSELERRRSGAALDDTELARVIAERDALRARLEAEPGAGTMMAPAETAPATPGGEPAPPSATLETDALAAPAAAQARLAELEGVEVENALLQQELARQAQESVPAPPGSLGPGAEPDTVVPAPPAPTPVPVELTPLPPEPGLGPVFPDTTALVDGWDAGKLDVNRATAEELQRVPHLTPRIAEYIIWYREHIAPLAIIDELKFVPGMTDNLWEELRKYLAVKP